uniref:Uncharacterized protein n=1 Tax=Zea mays TaxID=4577 RepID=C0PL90_MAIZE|nr:unknown [Zea mays]
MYHVHYSLCTDQGKLQSTDHTHTTLGFRLRGFVSVRCRRAQRRRGPGRCCLLPAKPPEVGDEADVHVPLHLLRQRRQDRFGDAAQDGLWHEAQGRRQDAGDGDLQAAPHPAPAAPAPVGVQRPAHAEVEAGWRVAGVQPPQLPLRDSEVEPAGAVPQLHDDDGAHGEEEELQRQHVDPPFPVADPLAPALVGEHGAEHARAVLDVLVEGDPGGFVEGRVRGDARAVGHGVRRRRRPRLGRTGLGPHGPPSCRWRWHPRPCVRRTASPHSCCCGWPASAAARARARSRWDHQLPRPVTLRCVRRGGHGRP